jgi:hypothetical protein
MRIIISCFLFIILIGCQSKVQKPIDIAWVLQMEQLKTKRNAEKDLVISNTFKFKNDKPNMFNDFWFNYDKSISTYKFLIDSKTSTFEVYFYKDQISEIKGNPLVYNSGSTNIARDSLFFDGFISYIISDSCTLNLIDKFTKTNYPVKILQAIPESKLIKPYRISIPIYNDTIGVDLVLKSYSNRFGDSTFIQCLGNKFNKGVKVCN